MKRFIVFLSLMLTAIFAFAQEGGVEMADELRRSGKIYVVVAVVLVVFIGIALYLFSIDRRLKKIEKQA